MQAESACCNPSPSLHLLRQAAISFIIYLVKSLIVVEEKILSAGRIICKMRM